MPTAAAISNALPARLQARLRSLGAVIAQASSDGGCVTLLHGGVPHRLHRLIVLTPAFAAAVRRAWPTLAGSVGACVEIWPHVWLAPVSEAKRRRGGEPVEQLTVGVFVGSAFLDTDQFRLLCDVHQLDAQAARHDAAAATWITAAEAARLAPALDWMFQDAIELERRDSELTGLSGELGETYEELSLLYRLSTSMTLEQHPKKFLADACSELQETVGMRWLAIQLIDSDPRMNELAGMVVTGGDLALDDQALQKIGSALMSAMPSNTKPWVIDDTSRVNAPGLAQASRTALVVPIVSDDHLLGVLLGGDKEDGSEINSIDVKLCSALANSLAIFIENLMLYEDMQAMFMGTLHALTSAIDAKDSYTHGHSERVALMSRMLAAAAGLDAATVERVYIAGLIHDVGKIGVPEAVLCKPGKLTQEEFELVKMHPEIGARILRDIRQMNSLIPGVLYHHERWDGKGYPRGLAGENIPLFGRLICLADSFDAMSSSRTYRKGLPHEQVLAEIKRCAGTQFDPELAELFIRLDFREYFNVIEKHQTELKRSA